MTYEKMCKCCKIRYCLCCIPIRKGLVIGAGVIMVDAVVLFALHLLYTGNSLIEDLALKAWYIFSLAMYFIFGIALLVGALQKSKIALQLYQVLSVCTVAIQLVISVMVFKDHYQELGAILYTAYTVLCFYFINIYIFIMAFMYYLHLRRQKKDGPLTTQSAMLYDDGSRTNQFSKWKLPNLTKKHQNSANLAHHGRVLDSVNQSIGM